MPYRLLNSVAWCRYVLTQFNSHALNTHLSQAYPPAVFGGPQKQGFVDVLAAHQTPTEASWYRGSADAVRRNLPSIFEDYRGSMLPDDMLILSGQALYRMVSSLHPPSAADATLRCCRMQPDVLQALSGAPETVRTMRATVTTCKDTEEKRVMVWGGMQDYGALLRTHRENNADITIATHAVGKKQAYLRGITKVEPDTGLLSRLLTLQ